MNLLSSKGLQFRAAVQFVISVTNSSGSPIEGRRGSCRCGERDVMENFTEDRAFEPDLEV